MLDQFNCNQYKLNQQSDSNFCGFFPHFYLVNYKVNLKQTHIQIFPLFLLFLKVTMDIFMGFPYRLCKSTI